MCHLYGLLYVTADSPQCLYGIFYTSSSFLTEATDTSLTCFLPQREDILDWQSSKHMVKQEQLHAIASPAEWKQRLTPGQSMWATGGPYHLLVCRKFEWALIHLWGILVNLRKNGINQKLANLWFTNWWGIPVSAIYYAVLYHLHSKASLKICHNQYGILAFFNLWRETLRKKVLVWKYLIWKLFFWIIKV